MDLRWNRFVEFKWISLLVIIFTLLIGLPAPTNAAAPNLLAGETLTLLTGNSTTAMTDGDETTSYTMSGTQLLYDFGVQGKAKSYKITYSSADGRIFKYSGVRSGLINSDSLPASSVKKTVTGTFPSNARSVFIGGYTASTVMTIYEIEIYGENDTTPPSVPSGLTGVAGDTIVNLNWVANSESDFKHYNLYRDGVLLKSVTGSTYVDTGLINKTTYKYQISAVDTSGNESGLSEALNLTPVAKAPESPSGLTVTVVEKSIVISWTAVKDADTYTVYRSTESGGPYSSISSGLNGTSFKDSEVTPGVEYFYVVSAYNEDVKGTDSKEVSATIPKNLNPILNVTINEESVKVNELFTSYISLENVSDIFAEDFTISYNADLMDYVGFEEIEGYKVYNESKGTKGTIRFIVASQGEEYGINKETTFLKVIFKAKAIGTGTVDAIKCRVADTINEYDIEEVGCMQDSVIIKGPDDVNRSGSYTLVDLAISGFYFGKTAAETDTVNHVADQVVDGNINNDDLVYIVNQILINPNYEPNM
ncbi:hypothetical protein ABEW34_03775 [Paenibacillus algorifonticola]|uniref:hypothetical protein n=1 Tax=Paenibacillus algorifonticola TaxID=684063 RepID=UPI003D2D3DE8